jgi:hypothetical protein
MKGNMRNKFWSLGKLRLSNFSALLSLLPLLIGGFFTVVTETKAEAKHTEECCIVVAQRFTPGFEDEGPFADRFDDRIYEVFVPTYSQDLLSFVRGRVDRRAQPTNRRGRPVITLGRYDLDGARERVRQLMRHGITSEMVASNSTANVSRLPWDFARFVVYVPVANRRDIEDALYNVQNVVPEASIWQYRGRNVILLGQFANQSEALQFRNELRRQGIRAQSVRNPNTSSISPVSRNEDNFVVSQNRSETRFVALENQVEKNNYYVRDNTYTLVVPGRREELAGIEAQVRQMAIDLGREDEVIVRYDSNRSQLIVGPFTQLEAAQEWESFLSEYGIINARVINGN